jgi:hypothetical protein
LRDLGEKSVNDIYGDIKADLTPEEQAYINNGALI